MRLVVLDGDAQLAEVICKDEAVYIGSREGVGLCLPDSNIAEQAAVIYPETDATWVLHKLTENGDVRLNGADVTEKVMLKSGDTISVDRFEIRAFVDEGGAHRPVTGRTTVANMTRFVKYQLPQGATVKKTDDPLTIHQSHVARMGKMTVSLGPCETVEELMDVALRTLLEMFAAQHAWIGIRRVNYGAMEYVEGRTLTGQTTELPEVGVNFKPRALDRGQFMVIPCLSRENHVSLMLGPLAGPDGTLGLAYVDSGETGRRYDPEDLDLFILVLHLLGSQLDAILKQMAKTRAAIVDGEVSVAHAIQSRLTPRKLPQWDELQFGAFREPGRERTGDVYDVVRLANKMALFMIAHTPAKGPVPSMLIAQAQAAFRIAAMHMDSPHIILRSLNLLLYDGQDDHALNCMVGVIEPPTGRMRYAIAGSMGAHVIDQRGEERNLALPDQEPALGSVRNASYANVASQLDPADTLVLFTPGVITARNSRNEIFGEERFMNILCDGFGQLASTMLKEMLSDLQSFTDQGSQPDDITVILAHRT